jgi:hypothetical protein
MAETRRSKRSELSSTIDFPQGKKTTKNSNTDMMNNPKETVNIGYDYLFCYFFFVSITYLNTLNINIYYRK